MFIVLRKEYDIDDLIKESTNYIDKSNLPLLFLQNVKKYNKFDDFNNVIRNAFTFEDGDLYTEDIFDYITIHYDELNKILHFGERLMTERELFSLSDNVFIRWPNGEKRLIHALTHDNFLEFASDDKESESSFWYYTVQDMVDKGITLDDGSSLYININDPRFSK